MQGHLRKTTGTVCCEYKKCGFWSHHETAAVTGNEQCDCRDQTFSNLRFRVSWDFSKGTKQDGR